MIITRQELEARESAVLAPYAARSGASRGRVHPEEEHAYRTAYQRDRDRIIHCTAFRRLEYKTQVFVNHEGDYYRTRLTHSVEAAQISRTVARALGLNEDLCEAVALSHDMGHTPFGHSGEDALRELMAPHGGFEHNLQALRIVDLLESRYPGFRGLNLTYETRESILQHAKSKERLRIPGFDLAQAPLLESQVVDIADAIAYDNHDLDDGLKSGILTEAELGSVSLWEEAHAEVARRHPGLSAQSARAPTIVTLINWEVNDLLKETSRRLEAAGVKGVADVRAAKGLLVGFSPPMAEKRVALQKFLYARFYRHYRVARMAAKARRIVTELFREYVADADQLPPEFQAWAKEVGLERGVADYLAGMTDRYAQQEWQRLFMPFERA